MTISDEQLMAYADGELPDAERNAIEAALAREPALAERVRAHQALRAQVADAFAGVFDEPVPAQLRERLAAAAADVRAAAANDEESKAAAVPSAHDGETPVISLDAHREQRKQERARRRWSWPEWGAMAASVLVGVLGTRMLTQGGDAIGTAPGTLVARGELANALSHQLAAEAPGAVRIGVSFRDKSGAWCRTFTYQGTAGLACRSGDQWNLPVLAQAAPAEGTYRQASSLPPAIMDAVDARINGAALDAAAEKAAASRGWAPPH